MVSKVNPRSAYKALFTRIEAHNESTDQAHETSSGIYGGSLDSGAGVFFDPDFFGRQVHRALYIIRFARRQRVDS